MRCALLYAVLFGAVAGASDTKKFTFTDLQPNANQKLSEDLGVGFPGNSFSALPTGRKAYGGTLFEVGSGLIQLGSKLLNKFPEKVESIKVGQAFDKLHILHATQFGGGRNTEGAAFVKDGTLIGEYRINYEDGSAEVIPIVYGEHVRDWYFVEEEKLPSKSKVVWTGENERSKVRETKLRIY